MQLLQKYFWTQVLWPLILALSALTTLALLTQSLQTLDLIVENRQSAFTFFYITILALPQLISVILPLAVFMATLYALNRLNMDSELIVAKASGISPWQISSPVLRLATYALIAHLIINLLLQPLSFREMRSEILKVRTDIASQMLQAGSFVTPTPKLTVYARDIGTDGSLKDVIIYDGRDDSGAITHLAKSGYVQRTNETAALVLRDGSVQQKLDDGSLDVIVFDDYLLDLSDVMAVDNVLRLKSSDRYLHELLRPDPREYITPKFRNQLTGEGHARLSAPIYNIALALLAVCFMVRGEHQRLGYGRRIAICAVTGFALRLCGFAVTSAAENNPGLNMLQYILPIGVVLLCLFYLTRPGRAFNVSTKRSRKNYQMQLERTA